MANNLDTTEQTFFERSRIALTNAESYTEIKPILADFEYCGDKIAEGWVVYNRAKGTWELNQKEDAESKIASQTYKAKYSELQTLFTRHRDFTLRFFKKQPEVLITLGVKGRFPAKYADLFDKVKQFYSGIKSDPSLQAQFDKIKITSAVVDKGLSLLDELLAERANYDKELGESQDVTKSKNVAIAELKDWMDDFDAIASIALYDKPQLLEVLGVFVRS